MPGPGAQAAAAHLGLPAGAPDAGTVVGAAVYAVLGLAMLAHTWRCWSGRSKVWARRVWSPPLVLGILPGLGFAALAAAVQLLFGDPAVPAVGLLVLAGFVLLALGFAYLAFEPRWWGPRWFRRLPARDRAPDISDPLTAATIGFSRPPRVRSTARTDVAARQMGGHPVARWGAGYVHDPRAAERAHGMARRGTVMGDLTLYPKGLTFAAKAWEDVLRNEPTAIVVPAGEINTIRVVQSDRRPRLMVETTRGRYVFDVTFGRNKRAAARIASTVGPAR